MTILSMFRLFFVTLTSKCVLYMHFDLLVTKNYLRYLSQSPNLAITILERAFASFQKRRNCQFWPLQLGTKIDSQISWFKLITISWFKLWFKLITTTIVIVINLNHKNTNIMLTLNGWNWLFSVVKIYFFSIGSKIYSKTSYATMEDRRQEAKL